MVRQALHSERHPPGSPRASGERAPEAGAWTDIGAKLARVGAPLEAAVIAQEEPIALELPLEGGQGIAPSGIEARRQVAAFVRDLYDDVFDYAVELPPAPEPVETAPELPAEDAPKSEPELVEVQAIDRKTGKPVKVKVRMQPQLAAPAPKPAQAS